MYMKCYGADSWEGKHSKLFLSIVYSKNKFTTQRMLSFTV